MEQQEVKVVSEYLKNDGRIEHLKAENIRGNMFIARMERGLTIKEASQLIGVNRTYYGLVEKGTKNPGELVEMKIKQFFGLESLD